MGSQRATGHVNALPYDWHGARNQTLAPRARGVELQAPSSALLAGWIRPRFSSKALRMAAWLFLLSMISWRLASWMSFAVMPSFSAFAATASFNRTTDASGCGALRPRPRPKALVLALSFADMPSTLAVLLTFLACFLASLASSFACFLASLAS